MIPTLRKLVNSVARGDTDLFAEEEEGPGLESERRRAMARQHEIRL
jgi:hypothetical protein